MLLGRRGGGRLLLGIHTPTPIYRGNEWPLLINVILYSGVLTEVCVAFPALTLIEQGYDVFVVSDASGTFAEHTREAAHKRMVQAGVQLLNWAAVAAELHRDWRADVEGFGGIWRDHIPGYWCLMQSYENVGKSLQK